MSTTDRLASVVLVVALIGFSCEISSNERRAEGVRDVEIIEVALGRSIRDDMTIPARRQTDVYRPDETVYLAMRVYGARTEVPLTVRWYYGERLLDESRRHVAPEGLSRTEFHYSDPGGMVPGPYQVVVILDGKEKRRMKFTVRSPKS